MKSPKEILFELTELHQKHPEWELLQFGSWVSAEQYTKLYELSRPYLFPSAKVLDWGAGNGHFSYFLTNSGYDVSAFGFENCTLEEILKKKGRFKFTRGDYGEPKKLPFAESEFDAVSSVGVLEHVRETGGTELESLIEIKRLLKEGGYFICYHLPNRLSYIEKLAQYRAGAHRHPYKFSKKEVNELLHQAGFRLLHWEKYGALPRNMGNSFPKVLRQSRFFGKLWNMADEILKYPFQPFLQNYCFIAQKPRVEKNRAELKKAMGE